MHRQVSDAAKKKKLAKNASKTKKLGTAGTAADKSSEQSSPAVSRNEVSTARGRSRLRSWDGSLGFTSNCVSRTAAASLILWTLLPCRALQASQACKEA